MPQVTILTGIVGPDGCEVTLAEYLCDRPGCPNIATRVVGCSRELGPYATCDEHAPGRLPGAEST